MSTRCSPPMLAGLLIMLTSACGDSLAPGTLGQAYSLTRVANDPLPTVLQANENVTIRVIAQVIRFGPKGAGSISETKEVVFRDDPDPAPPAEVHYGMHWAEAAGRIEIEFDCPATPNCVGGPHLIARIDGSDLQAEWGPHVTGRSPLRYEEVPATQ